jgi:hypothetical protein
LDPEEFEVFGLGGSVVMKLANTITSPNHQLYFDNYFTNYNVIEALGMKKIYCADTARVNRFSNPPLTPDNDMKKTARGNMEEAFTSGGLVVTKWFDNKPVIVDPYFVGIGNKDQCKKYDKSRKEYVQVVRPDVIRRYYESMGRCRQNNKV